MVMMTRMGWRIERVAGGCPNRIFPLYQRNPLRQEPYLSGMRGIASCVLKPQYIGLLMTTALPLFVLSDNVNVLRSDRGGKPQMRGFTRFPSRAPFDFYR